MDDLVRWYGQQLDEDERLAHAADGTVGGLDKDWTYQPADDTSGRVVARGFYVVILDVQGNVGEHVAAHDPRRVLQEIAARRQAIAHYQAVRNYAREHEAYVLAEGAVVKQIQIAASAYDQRPGYREEWRP